MKASSLGQLGHIWLVSLNLFLVHSRSPQNYFIKRCLYFTEFKRSLLSSSMAAIIIYSTYGNCKLITMGNKELYHYYILHPFSPYAPHLPPRNLLFTCSLSLYPGVFQIDKQQKVRSAIYGYKHLCKYIEYFRDTSDVINKFSICRFSQYLLSKIL